MAQVDNTEQLGSIEKIPFGDPPSPWLRRYGGVLDPILRREGRSGLAPKFPDLEPLGVNVDLGVDVDGNVQPLPRPSDAELDSLLCDEATQLIENRGWKSWQVGAFAEGSENEPFNDLINVDPTKWHPLFRMERWYDLQVPLVLGDPSKGIMSIDNPLVWKDMSVVIELANRMFCMLLLDGFFDTLLGLVPFSEVQCASKSKAYTDANTNPKCARRVNISEELRDNVRNAVCERVVGLACSIVITWCQDRSPQGNKLPQTPLAPEVRSCPPWGITSHEIGENGMWCVQIQLAASIFRSISQCDDTTQDGRTEKRLLMFSYASTFLHEMSHAVYRCNQHIQDTGVFRETDAAEKAEFDMFAQGLKTFEAAKAALDAISSALPSRLIGFEPAIEDDNLAEVGYAAEQAAFGGTVSLVPHSGSTVGSCMHTLNSTYQLLLCQFPADAARFMAMPYSWDAETRWAFPRVDMTHVIPASHAAHLLSQTYWEQCCYGSMGITALRPLKVFPSSNHMAMQHQPFSNPSNVFDQDLGQSWEARTMGAWFPGIGLRKEVDIMGRHQYVFERLVARQNQWNRMRPWYQVERQRWACTPYGHYHLRLSLTSFNHAVATEDEKEANAQLGQANFLVQTLPPYRVDADVSLYYEIVAVAMTAALPWRTRTEQVDVEPDIKSWKVSNLWQPSNAARMRQALPTSQNGSPFAFKPEMECQNVVVSYWPGGMLPAPAAVMSPREGRLFMLKFAIDGLHQMKQDGRIQSNVYKETMDQFTLLTNEVNSRETDYTGFLTSFALSLPIYTVDQQKPPAKPGLPPAPVPFAQPLAQVVAAQGAGPGQGQNVSNAQGGANAFVVRVVEQQDLTTKYWSAGEVGDHGGEDGQETWVLVYNDELGGYDVFSVSTLPPRGALQVDFEYGVRVTDAGVAARIRALHGTFRGRLLLPRSKEEIAENDGRRGGPKWVLAGPYIYDITHFPAKDDDQHEFLWSAPYGDVLHVVMTTRGPHQLHLDDLQRRLYPFRCATLRQQEPASDDSALWRPYTMREVNWHVFPQIRAFTSVDGWVYDITEFADASPLGRHKLLGLAGREVGMHIRSHFPPEWTERFLRDVASYRVGWVVPERVDDARLILKRHEIQLRDCIYSFAVLVQNPKTKEDADLGRALSSFGGMDATEHLAQKHRMQLKKRPELVVAKLYSEPTFEVGQEDLEAHGSVSLGGLGATAGEHGAEDDEEEDQNLVKYTLDGSTWARIGDVVYDVSNLVNYGDDATRASVLAFAGGAITDAGLIHDIQRCGVAPAIGRFVGKKPGVKRKWSKMMAKGTTPSSGFGLGLHLPPPDERNLPEHGRPRFGCGCTSGQNLLEREHMEQSFMHEVKLPPVDPEDLAAFSYAGMREGKRMRLV